MKQSQKIGLAAEPPGFGILVFAKVTDIDTGQDDFFRPHGGYGVGIGYDLIDGLTATFTSRQRDGTKSTIVIASVLDLQERTGSITKRERLIKVRNGLNILYCHEAFAGGVPQLIDVIQNLEFFTGPQNKIHPGNISDFFRF